MISLLNIKNRHHTNLIDKVKNVRISHFSSPSSFYVQLCDEDIQYNSLEREMYYYYGAANFKFIDTDETQSSEIADTVCLKQYKIAELKSRMNITIKCRNKWIRCLTCEENPRRCKMIDTGITFNLYRANEESGIYELEHQFLTLPPRAILCGLGKIVPLSSKGYQWSKRACDLFTNLTKNQNLHAYFMEKGIFENTYYIFLTCTSKHTDTSVHINIALCAYDVALRDVIGLHHPIWPNDQCCKD